MKTAALLPTPGDPLLARYWVRNYEQTWQGEVDELIVFVNGNSAAVPIYEEAGANVYYTPVNVGHGQAMKFLLGSTAADIVMFTEDDAFVRLRRAITGAVNAIANDLVDVIGCPRGGMDPIIAEAATKKWGPVLGPDRSTGHGLWPAFLFARRDALMATDQRFESTTWQTGERVPGLGFRVPRPMTTDTMTSVAFQLRDQCRIALTVNHKEMDQKDLPGGYLVPGPDREDWYTAGGPAWFHAGGLSNDPYSIRDGIPPESNEGRDWAHRFWWWRRIGHDYDPKGQDVDYWTPILEPWINWDD